MWEKTVCSNNCCEPDSALPEYLKYSNALNGFLYTSWTVGKVGNIIFRYAI